MLTRLHFFRIRVLWLLIATLSISLSQLIGAESREFPNIVVIVADDLGYEDLGVHGSAEVETPHLDSMAENGVLCTNAYVTSPVCSPSRAGLLTGRYQNRFGFEFLVNETSLVREGATNGLPASETTFAARLQELGYRTGCIGKWHLGTEEESWPTNCGFDEFYGTLRQGNYFSPILVDSRIDLKPRKVSDPDYYLTDDYSLQAVEFVEEHQAKPFFLYLPHFAVHKPHDATAKYLDRFEAINDPTRHRYVAMLSAMDDAVGSLLSSLRECGLEEDTLIFFLSDNGGTMGSSNAPLRGKKGGTWEGGIRTPFLVQWKGVLPAGMKYDGLLSALDIAPTALAVAGQKVDPGWEWDGVNLLPYLSGEKKGSPHEVLYWRFGTQWAIRKGAWKLLQAREEKGGNIQIAREGPVRLFHLEEDVGEENDLSSSRPEKVRELQEAWDRWNALLPEPSWKPVL